MEGNGGEEWGKEGKRVEERGVRHVLGRWGAFHDSVQRQEHENKMLSPSPIRRFSYHHLRIVPTVGFARDPWAFLVMISMEEKHRGGKSLFVLLFCAVLGALGRNHMAFMQLGNADADADATIAGSDSCSL